MGNVNTISILGCGWFGFALAQNLISGGYTVKGSCTSDDKFDKLLQTGIQPFTVTINADSEVYDIDFLKCDVLVISIPPKRNSDELEIYPSKIKRIKALVQNANIKRVLFISSTAVFGDHNEVVNEDTIPQPDSSSGKVILESENLLKDQTDFKVTILRFGGLIGPDRDPARFFSGKKNIPNGKAPVNLVHLNDCIGVTNTIIKKDAFGYTFNLCATNHPPKMVFYKQAAIKSGMELPDFIDELVNWKVVTSKYIEQILDYTISNQDISS